MTVKDVFELRRQGRIEEAYDAIRPMYAVHKGRYTTLCMFWTARDMFNLRLHEGPHWRGWQDIQGPKAGAA